MYPPRKVAFVIVLKFYYHVASFKMAERKCEKSVRNRQNVRNINDKREGIISHYRLKLYSF